jgi:hypothetical protein
LGYGIVHIMKTCIALMSPLGKRKPWEHIITKNPGGTFSHLSNIKDPIRLQVSLLYYLYIILVIDCTQQEQQSTNTFSFCPYVLR